MSKSAVRMAIASNFGGEKNSVSCLRSCLNGLIRVQTHNTEESVIVVEGLKRLPGTVLFFQAYDVDDNGSGGSIFVIGGDEDFMSWGAPNIWHLCPGIQVERQF